MTSREAIYNRKQYWKRRLRTLDCEVLKLLNLELKGDLTVPLLDYKAIAERIVAHGLFTEDLLGQAAGVPMSDRVLHDLRDACNTLEMYSARVKEIAERKWGRELRVWPLYRSTVSATAVLPKTPAELEMDKLLGGNH